MKKIALLAVFIFATATLTSCKSQKQKGCATSAVDSLHIQSTSNTVFVA